MINISDNRGMILLGVDDLEVGYAKIDTETDTHVLIIKSGEKTIEIYANDKNHIQSLIDSLQSMLSEMK